MYLPLLASLLIAATASPIGNLEPRKSCAMKTAVQTIGDQDYTLTGPFQIKVQGDFDKSGYSAHFGVPSDSNQIIFDVSPKQIAASATQFHLNKAGHLLALQDDQIYRAYVTAFDDGNLDDENVIMSVEKGLGNKVICKVEDSCEMSCAVEENAFQCLGSPGFQPDWRIAAEHKGAGVGCQPVTVMAVPV